MNSRGEKPGPAPAFFREAALRHRYRTRWGEASKHRRLSTGGALLLVASFATLLSLIFLHLIVAPTGAWPWRFP